MKNIAPVALVLFSANFAFAQVSDPQVAGVVRSHQIALQEYGEKIDVLEQDVQVLKEKCESGEASPADCNSEIVTQNLEEVRQATNVTIKRIGKIEGAVRSLRDVQRSDVTRINEKLKVMEPMLLEIYAELPHIREIDQFMEKISKDLQITRQEIESVKVVLEGVLQDLKLFKKRLDVLEEDLLNLKQRVAILEKEIKTKQNRIRFGLGPDLRFTTDNILVGLRLDWEITRPGCYLVIGNSIGYAGNSSSLSFATRFVGKCPIKSVLSINYGVIFAPLYSQDRSVVIDPLAAIVGFGIDTKRVVLLFSAGAGVKVDNGDYKFTPVIEASIMARF